jgi:hypothetical protein
LFQFYSSCARARPERIVLYDWGGHQEMSKYRDNKPTIFDVLDSNSDTDPPIRTR